MKKWDWNHLNLYTTCVDLLRNLWVIFLAGVIGFFGCFTYYTYIRPVEYTSEMTLAINLSGYTTSYTSYSLARTVSIAEVLTDVFNSDAMETVAAKHLGEPINGSVSATQTDETNLVSVSVTSTEPMKAYRALQAVYGNYGEVTEYVFNNTIISVLKEPSIPTRPSHSSLYFSRSVLLCLLLMVLTACIIAVLSYYRFTLKNTEDAELYLDTRLFGTVFHEKIKIKKGQAKRPLLVLNGPFVSYEFSENFRKMAIKLESLKRTKHINSVMVTSVAENEGKTTVSVNLAMALSMEGNKVALIDADLKKPSIHYFFRKTEHKPENELSEYLKGNVPLQQVIKQDPATGLYLLGGKKPSRDSSELLTGPAFKKLLREMEDTFDFVVIDTPPSGYAVDAEIVSGMVSCAVLVARQDHTDIAEIQDYLAVLNNNTYVAGCLLNDIHRFGGEKATAARGRA